VQVAAPGDDDFALKVIESQRRFYDLRAPGLPPQAVSSRAPEITMVSRWGAMRGGL